MIDFVRTGSNTSSPRSAQCFKHSSCYTFEGIYAIAQKQRFAVADDAREKGGSFSTLLEEVQLFFVRWDKEWKSIIIELSLILPHAF